MDKNTLLKRLSDIEWDDFEVKKSSGELPKNVWETVSAFSSTSGGWLVLGVSQNGKTFEVTGVVDPEKIDISESDKTTGKQPETNQKPTRNQPDIKSRILTVLSLNPTISRSEIAKQLGVSEGSLRYHLEKLKSDGLLKREGADKGGKWVVANSRK